MRTLLIFTVAALATLGGATPAGAIVNGTVTTEPYPFIASLHDAEFGHLCGASILDSTTLVTAAHCVDQAVGEPHQLAIRHGSARSDTGGTVVPITEIRVHPEYERVGPGKKYADIAVLKVAQMHGATPIAIPAVSPAVGTGLRLLGWGRTCADTTEPCPMSPELRRLDVALVPDSDCTMSTSKELCVGNPDGRSGPCGGDSGGPALARGNGRWELVGATARPGIDTLDERCGEGPGIYTDLVEHRAWVLDQL